MLGRLVETCGVSSETPLRSLNAPSQSGLPGKPGVRFPSSLTTSLASLSLSLSLSGAAILPMLSKASLLDVLLGRMLRLRHPSTDGANAPERVSKSRRPLECASRWRVAVAFSLTVIVTASPQLTGVRVHGLRVKSVKRGLKVKSVKRSPRRAASSRCMQCLLHTS